MIHPAVALLVFGSLCGASILCGCSKQTEPEPTSELPPAPDPEAVTPDDASADRPTLTAQECETQGGTVVGDIGDGAIHQPGYRCPSGTAPSGTVKAADGEPVAVEGAVCCPQ